jgi:hypothetical protein
MMRNVNHHLIRRPVMIQGFLGALVLALGTIALILKVEKALKR